MIVDDEPQIGWIFALKLRLSGYEVECTTSGAEALDLLRKHKFDAMLLDILMPGMSGLDVLRELRTFSQLPVAVFSAKLDLFPTARSLGADDCISKPVHPDELVERIRALLADKESPQVTR
ncbi:MAG: response regulator [Chloroflexi bacterium]|nr:response regulator [Chloroflexota bacterium]